MLRRNIMKPGIFLNKKMLKCQSGFLKIELGNLKKNIIIFVILSMII